MIFDLRESREDANSWYDKLFITRNTDLFYPKEEIEKFITFDKNTDNWEITIIYFDERCIRGEIKIPTLNDDLIYPKTLSGEKKNGQKHFDLIFTHSRTGRHGIKNGIHYTSDFWDQIRKKDNNFLSDRISEICVEAVILNRIKARKD